MACTCGELTTPCWYYVDHFDNSSTNADDDFDLFGEETEADKESAKQLAEKKKAEAAKTKKVIINKSSLVIEVKPSSIDTNLDEVLRLVKEIKMEGLTWGESSKKVAVAYGLYKLQVSCSIVDDLVNTTDIIDRIEALGMDEQKAAERKHKREYGDDEDEDEDEEPEGLVQSAEIVSFNKL